MSFPGAQTNSRVAAGTINPFSFIQTGNMLTVNGSNELLALQCTGPGVEILGIAAIWTDNLMGTQQQLNFAPQGYPAAVSGEGLMVWGDGNETIVMVGSGYTVEPDNLLGSDASGNAIPISATNTSKTAWIGARAIEGGVAGDPIRVTVVLRPPPILA